MTPFSIAMWSIFIWSTESVHWESSAEGILFLAQIVACGGDIYIEIFDSDVFFAAYTFATVSCGKNVENPFAREFDIAFSPDNGRFMVGGVVAGCNGKRVFCSFCYYDFYFIFIPKPEGGSFLAGQVEMVTCQLDGSTAFENELSIFACSRASFALLKLRYSR